MHFGLRVHMQGATAQFYILKVAFVILDFFRMFLLPLAKMELRPSRRPTDRPTVQAMRRRRRRRLRTVAPRWNDPSWLDGC